jgi:homogentisate 1,2-dioxygenase
MLRRGKGGELRDGLFGFVSPSSRHRRERTFMRLERERRRRLMRTRTLAVAIAAALCGLIAAPALAQNAAPAPAAAPAKHKPKTPADANTVAMTVTNSRKADLVQLQAAESGSVAWKKVLGPLKAGAHATAVLPRPFNCRVDLHGTFANGESIDATDVDVCAQKTLNLTD